ncbi:MAG: ATP-binding protein [candidate division WOR-3 bacterium]
MKNIFFRIFFGQLILISCVSLFFVLFSFGLVKRYYVNTLTENLEKIALSLRRTLTPYLVCEKFSSLDSLAKYIGKEIKVRITVVDLKGVVLADSEENPEKMENHGTRPEILQAFYGKTGISLRFSKTFGKDMLYVAIPIKDEKGEVFGVIRLSLFFTQIDELIGAFVRNLLIVVFSLLFFSIFVSFFYSKSLAKPIGELVSIADEVAKGNFELEVFVEGKGELKRLAESFNSMLTRIRELVSKLSEQRDSLDIVISSIGEALLVINSDEKIVIVNDSFKEIFNVSEVKNKYYWEVFREPQFGEIIEEVKKKRDSVVKEIKIGERYFICTANFLKKYNEVVITLHEITEKKKTELMKKDFISNVSHELRTPLTAIKGFVETLLETQKGDGKRYLEIIRKQTDRLINIVKDLLRLSELEEIEEGKIKIDFSQVDLKKLIKDVLSIYEKEMKDKGLRLVVSIDRSVSKIKGDPFKLEQLFMNLIENAIRYTDKGEIKINARREKRAIVIEVSDTGIGISEEHLPRIFERFYVVDKSRSREYGGTGLGLSIVKHIVQLHQGEIRVESKKNKGTKFTIILPEN